MSQKIFISQLCDCQRLENKWTFARKDGSQGEFNFLWLQGTVVETADNGDSLVIDDGTGLSEVDLRKLKQAGLRFDNLCPAGQYVMVAGKLTQLEPKPLIAATKFVDLSDNPERETLWNLEVVDAHTDASIH
eukprot:Colp12_sorted_trinity150504_noHs@22788